MATRLAQRGCRVEVPGIRPGGNITACNHLEETMFPVETLAKEYIVVPPVQVPNDSLDKAQVIRILAADGKPRANATR